MKKITSAILFLSLLFINGSFNKPQLSVTGAWHEQKDDEEAVIILTHDYIVVAEFNQINTSFTYGSGGSFSEKKAGQLIVEIDFSSRKKESGLIGTKGAMIYSISGDKMTVTMNDSTKRVVTRVDDGSGELAGTWRMSARMNSGKIEAVPNGPVKMIKVLSAKRFQWVSFNTETNEFIGSGGGTYTFKDGKYKENIEFFAKNSYKIGTSQTFDATIDNNVWTNKGSSSQEEWTRVGN
jgi:hypothetical protein